MASLWMHGATFRTPATAYRDGTARFDRACVWQTVVQPPFDTATMQLDVTLRTNLGREVLNSTVNLLALAVRSTHGADVWLAQAGSGARLRLHVRAAPAVDSLLNVFVYSGEGLPSKGELRVRIDYLDQAACTAAQSDTDRPKWFEPLSLPVLCQLGTLFLSVLHNGIKIGSSLVDVGRLKPGAVHEVFSPLSNLPQASLHVDISFTTAATKP